MNNFVIASTGRSATGYTAKIMQHHGIECGHEKYFNREFKWGDTIGNDSSWLCVPYLKQLREQGWVIIHQVRDPLKTMNSILKYRPNHWWHWVEQWIPLSNNRTIDTINFWYVWNIKIEKYSHWRFKVEDIEDHWDIMMDMICGIDIGLKWKRNEISKAMNTVGVVDQYITMDMLPIFVKEKIHEYGY